MSKWTSLSIHWDVSLGADKSSVWCNGKKLLNLTARTSPSATKTIIGDPAPDGNPNLASRNETLGLEGSIAFFNLYTENIVRDSGIRLHHVHCSWYKIDHNPITQG